MKSVQSLIGIVNDDNHVKAISCYENGGIKGVGAMLLRYYDNPTKIISLINLGEIETLGAEIGEKHDPRFEYHKLNYTDKQIAKLSQWCCAYHRDHGWDMTQPKEFYFDEIMTLFKKAPFEYIYLYRESIMVKGWWYSCKPFSEWRWLYSDVSKESTC